MERGHVSPRNRLSQVIIQPPLRRFAVPDSSPTSSPRDTFDRGAEYLGREATIEVERNPHVAGGRRRRDGAEEKKAKEPKRVTFPGGRMDRLGSEERTGKEGEKGERRVAGKLEIGRAAKTWPKVERRRGRAAGDQALPAWA